MTVAIIIILTAAVLPSDLFAQTKVVSPDHKEDRRGLHRMENVDAWGGREGLFKEETSIKKSGEGEVPIRASPMEADRIRKLGFRPLRILEANKRWKDPGVIMAGSVVVPSLCLKDP